MQLPLPRAKAPQALPIISRDSFLHPFTAGIAPPRATAPRRGATLHRPVPLTGRVAPNLRFATPDCLSAGEAQRRDGALGTRPRSRSRIWRGPSHKKGAAGADAARPARPDPFARLGRRRAGAASKQRESPHDTKTKVTSNRTATRGAPREPLVRGSRPNPPSLPCPQPTAERAGRVGSSRGLAASLQRRRLTAGTPPSPCGTPGSARGRPRSTSRPSRPHA